MLSFSYKGSATIKHLNVRKEGEEDDRELAVDVKFEHEGKTVAVFGERE